MKMGAWRPLATDTVRYVGDAVAVVVAETHGQARDAAEAVEVDYEELPAVTDAVEALKDGAPQLHPEAPGNLIFDWEIGDAQGDRRGDRQRRPCHRDEHRQQPAGRPTPWSRAPRSASTTRPKTTTPARRPARTRMSPGW